MRERSELWAKLARHGRFNFEAKARICGKDYFKISAPKITRTVMSAPLSVGNCNAATLGLSVLTDDEIPPGGEIVIWGRIYNEKSAGEWTEYGTFYIDQRDTSYSGLVKISCFDAMLKANQDYLDPDDITGQWPRTMKSVVEEIAYRIGVGIDPRTKIRTGPDYVVPYPEGKTMSQVLGYIGACHGGNWIVTEENRLRLVPLVTAPDETYHVIDEDYNTVILPEGDALSYKHQEVFYRTLPVIEGETPGSVIPVRYYITDHLGQRIVTPQGDFLVWNTLTQSVETLPNYGPYNVPVVCGQLTKGPVLTVSRISISDDNGNVFTAGNDTGFNLEIDGGPFATQQICDDLFTVYNGLVYAPFSATQSIFDPDAEPGDQIKIGGMVHSVFYNASVTLAQNYRVDLSAPNNEALSQEYPFLTQFKKLQIQENIERRKLEGRITSLVERTETSIRTEISRVESEAGAERSRIEQYVDSITLEVTNSYSSSTIKLKAGETVIKSQDISFTGLVTFTSLDNMGFTQINGGSVTTTEINLDRVILTGSTGGFTTGTGETLPGETTTGAKMYGSDSRFYVIATNAGVRMTAISNHFRVSPGETVSTYSVHVSSDRRMKNTISIGLEKYVDFFKRLMPAYYRFNPDDSERFHVGFIAQDVENALHQSGLSEADFSGLRVGKETIEKSGDEYSLRYDEFVPLNTYMIQKALAEIAELKEKLKQMEATS